MDVLTKAAVVTWLLDNRIKLVHIWDCGDHWQAMVETPPCGTRGGTLTYPAEQRVGVGTGDTGIAALLAALDRVGAMTLKFRLHLLEFMVEHLANRAGPALLRRLENGR